MNSSSSVPRSHMVSGDIRWSCLRGGQGWNWEETFSAIELSEDGILYLNRLSMRPQSMHSRTDSTRNGWGRNRRGFSALRQTINKGASKNQIGWLSTIKAGPGLHINSMHHKIFLVTLHRNRPALVGGDMSRRHKICFVSCTKLTIRVGTPRKQSPIVWQCQCMCVPTHNLRIYNKLHIRPFLHHQLYTTNTVFTW